MLSLEVFLLVTPYETVEADSANSFKKYVPMKITLFSHLSQQATVFVITWFSNYPFSFFLCGVTD